ncbi:MAG: polyprenyl synthetase [Cenarchaeum symbiont of Oopsacas minuta]|nr:polyprenyl synthetase [Cenarchaeum symbiont of Oopsacas minuta]
MDRKNLGINPLLESYGTHIERIDKALEDELNLYSGSEFLDPLKYAIADGKRIRPIILALAAESVGGDDGSVDENVYAAACAIEFLHTESVIHDDIVDDEKKRRLKDPFHIKFGHNKSMLTGDFMLGVILNIASRLDNPRITKDLAMAAMQMSEGEAMEERLEGGQDVTFDDYLKVIEYKTAAAFKAAAKIGAIISGGTDVQVTALTSFGKNIGIAYQIRDDLLDWKNEDKIFNMLIKKSKDPRDVFDKMEELLKNYSSNARSALANMPESHARAKLDTLVEFTMFKA